jgi:hypothetical protein
MPMNLKLRVLGTRELLPHPLSIPRCVRTQAPPDRRPAPRNVTRWQPTQNGTPLAAATSIRLLSGSAVTEIDIASEDGPSAPPITKSRTHAIEDSRASNSASASRHVTNSTLSCLSVSSGWLASSVRLGSVPRSWSQTLAAGHSSREHWPSTF